VDFILVYFVSKGTAREKLGIEVDSNGAMIDMKTKAVLEVGLRRVGNKAILICRNETFSGSTFKFSIKSS
jgi:hypothetical protein